MVVADAVRISAVATASRLRDAYQAGALLLKRPCFFGVPSTGTGRQTIRLISPRASPFLNPVDRDSQAGIVSQRSIKKSPAVRFDSASATC